MRLCSAPQSKGLWRVRSEKLTNGGLQLAQPARVFEKDGLSGWKRSMVWMPSPWVSRCIHSIDLEQFMDSIQYNWSGEPIKDTSTGTITSLLERKGLLLIRVHNYIKHTTQGIILFTPYRTERLSSDFHKCHLQVRHLRPSFRRQDSQLWLLRKCSTSNAAMQPACTWKTQS